MEVASARTASKDTNTLLGTHNTSNKPFYRRKKKCLTIVGVSLVIFLILLILGLTVLKTKNPKVTTNSIVLDNLSASLDPFPPRVDLNVTIRIDLSLKNPNIVGMKYKNITAYIYYRDELVGEVHVPAGKIGAHATQRMNVTLLILADRLVLNPYIYADVIAGSIQLTTMTKISGKVKILKLFTISISASSTCFILIDVNNKAISSSTCTTKT